MHKKKGASIETEEMLLRKNVPKAIIEYKRKILESAQKEKEEEIKDAQENKLPNDDINKRMMQYKTLASLITMISKERGWVVLKWLTIHDLPIDLTP